MKLQKCQLNIKLNWIVYEERMHISISIDLKRRCNSRKFKINKHRTHVFIKLWLKNICTRQVLIVLKNWLQVTSLRLYFDICFWTVSYPVKREMVDNQNVVNMLTFFVTNFLHFFHIKHDKKIVDNLSFVCTLYIFHHRR